MKRRALFESEIFYSAMRFSVALRTALPKITCIAANGDNLGRISAAAALALFDHKLFVLRRVSELPLEAPVHRIFALERKAAPKREVKAAVSVKEVEINTNIHQHDLAFKLSRATAFLVKGHRVKFTINTATNKGVPAKPIKDVYQEVVSALATAGKPLNVVAKTKKWIFEFVK